MTLQLCKRQIFNAVRSKPEPNCNHCSSSFVLFYSTSDSKPTSENVCIFDLLRKYDIAPGTASTAASALSDLKNHEKCDSILFFLKENGFSKSQLERILIRRPRMFAGSLDNTIKPKIQSLRAFGISAPDIASIIAFEPLILRSRIDERVVPSFMVLKDVLGSLSEVTKLITKPGCALFLRYDLQKTLLPNIDILRSCGVSSDRIIKTMFSHPRFLLSKPEKMQEWVEVADMLGSDRNSRLFIYAVRTIASMSSAAWELKWDIFRNLGIPEDKMIWMFNKKPQTLAISGRKIKEVVKFLLDTGKYDLEYISSEPDVFACSIEKNLKPRFRFVEILESKGLLKKSLRLSSIYKCSNEMFFKLFVFPYFDEDPEIKLVYKDVFANLIPKDVAEKTLQT